MIKTQLVSKEKINEIIETREERGLFLTQDGDKYIAVDNTDGEAWTEEYNDITEAVQYLYYYEKPIR